jgi:putative intracellular protease/amidase
MTVCLPHAEIGEGEAVVRLINERGGMSLLKVKAKFYASSSHARWLSGPIRRCGPHGRCLGTVSTFTCTPSALHLIINYRFSQNPSDLLVLIRFSMTRNVRIVPDTNLADLSPATAHETYDILIIPGGGPGAATFCKNDAVLGLITNFRDAGKWVAAICAGTTALVAAQEKKGGARKVKVTSHPSVKEKIEREGWAYSEERVVVDEQVITSRG